jgi:hypothetical protein
MAWTNANGERILPMRTSPRMRAGAVAALLAINLLFAGCLDLVFPQPEPDTRPADHGILRVWAATTQGGISNEFVHYNVTFGGVAHARDLMLDELHPMEMRNREVDLVHMERERKAIEIARARVPDGEYQGFAFYMSQAKVAVERIVGSENGRPVTKIEEQLIDYSSSIAKPRAGHAVIGGRVTDLYLEIDLQRSFLRGDSGTLRHVTVPAGVAVYVDGHYVAWRPMDGGASRYPEGPTRENDGPPQYPPPLVDLTVRDLETDKRHYWSLIHQGKRIGRAMGLHEDVVYDSSASHSQIIRGDYSTATADFVPIVEHKWDFGDGEILRGPKVTKNYTKGGIYDVVLTIRDSENNIASDHVTLFVPYTIDQVVKTRNQSASGQLLIGTQDLPLDSQTDHERHSFRFPEDLEDGTLRLGGYSVHLVTTSPAGGNLLGLQDVRLSVESGRFKTQETSNHPITLETAGIPVWRGPLSHWVKDEIDLEVQLMTGVLAEYELMVEAHYYYNLSRGLDHHPHHLHGSWPFGPMFNHLHWDGTREREE